MKKLLVLIFLIYAPYIFAQQLKYEVFETSVNSKYAELGVAYLKNNKILFASSQKTEKDKAFSKDRRKHNREFFLDLYTGTVTDGGDVVNPVKFNNDIYNKFFEDNLTFSPDFKTLYFTWNNFFNSESSRKEVNTYPLYMFKASINSDYQPYNITPVPFNNKNYSIKNPSFSEDGTQLLFASNMQGGFGNYDIYVCDVFPDGNLSWPKNMGETINTSGNELFPFETSDKTLYFSSDGHQGKGGLDIFKSEFKNGKYQPIENLPAPINTKYDDFSFITKNSTEGFITSNRPKGKGDVDIYAFKIKKIEPKKVVENITVKEKTKKQEIKVNTTIKEKQLAEIQQECKQTISGLLFNKNSGKQLDDVVVSLYSNEKLLDSQRIALGYNYSFSLQCNTDYEVIAKKDGFVTKILKISTNSVANYAISKSIALEQFNCKQTLNGSVINIQTNEPLTKAKVLLYKKNTIKDTLLLDTNAQFSTKLDCNTAYRLVGSQKNYIDDITIIETSNTPNESITRKLLLKSFIEFVIKNNKKMIAVDVLNFELNKFNINENMWPVLNKVIDVLNKYPALKITIKNHTDNRAPHDYNMSLSGKRAESIKNFLINHYIDSNRIEAMGMGETEPINKCKPTNSCTNAEHLENIRTEFIVTAE